MTTRSMATCDIRAAKLAVRILYENGGANFYTIRQLPDDDDTSQYEIVTTSANRNIAPSRHFVNGILYACEIFVGRK